jgi:DNA topoisomerase-2
MASKYQKLDQRAHVLLRPGMYIGSVDRQASEMWVWREGGMRLREVCYSPGLSQIFLEVLTNAVDHSLRSKVSEIRVDIDRVSGEISVWNDGDGIDCSMTSEGVFGPELIFGHFLSGSNFDDTGDRAVAGAHGIGAKASNAFSSRFRVETLDAESQPKVLYRQEWRSNMETVSEPSIERLKGKQKPHTRVTFTPDYARFGSAGLDDDAMEVLSKHVVDASAVTPAGTSVYLNGERVPCKTFKDYCRLYTDAVVYDVSGSSDSWEVAVASSPDGNFRQVSFVNGLCTPRGGKHVEHVAAAVAKKLSARLTTKSKAVTVKTAKSAMWVFVKARVSNPVFDSQNKQTLTTPVEKFQTRYEVSDAFVKGIVARTDIGDRVQKLGMLEDDNKLRKTDGTQRRTVTGIPNFDDAHAAGTAESSKCTLVLTEGLSARSTAVAGLAAVGRKYHGVMALKGKPLNPRDTSKAKIGENEEIKNLKKALGLESGKTYETASEVATLRYGRVTLGCDADGDGDHICALVCNIFHSQWPALMRIPGFVSSIRTPVVVAKKGKDRRSFYHLLDFERWQSSAESRGWVSTFYKGLGLINSEEAREYFGKPKLYKFTCARATGTEDLTDRPVTVRLVVGCSGTVRVHVGTDAGLPRDDDDAFELAFRKTRAEDRKRWLNAFDKSSQLPPDAEYVSMKQFVSQQLCHYSWDDVQRSLPHAVDGLKESTRKILFALKSRPASAKHIRVAQMAAYVGQVSAYRHGEASLTGAIVGMGQSFVGCGHVPLLLAEGQFGTRIVGGKDAAASRYIHCDIGRAANLIFPVEDEPLLERNLDDDRKPVEATYYIPVLPLLLLNGSVGIGTGWSSNVPCFSPSLVALCYKEKISGRADAFERLRDASPSYRGFKGSITKADGGKWVSRGIASKNGKTIRITELPVGTWFSDYKVFLEQLCAENGIGLKRFESNYTDTAADYTLHFESSAAASAVDVYSALRLESDRLLSLTNMHALDTLKTVRKYDTPADIAEDHFVERRKAYERRLVHQRDAARKDLAVAAAKEGFVRAVVGRELDIGLAPETRIAEFARARGWPEVGGSHDYLSCLPIGSMTREKHARLAADVESKKERLRALLDATVESVWTSEIDAVLSELAS